MIGKAKAISHGINALRYIKGESRNKKEPEKIHHVCDQYLSPDLDAMGITEGSMIELEYTVDENGIKKVKTISIQH